MLRPVTAAAWMLVAIATTASAQSPDFASQIQPTVSANDLLVREIRDTMPGDDLAAMSQQTVLLVDAGEQLAQQLSQALVSAPDDAARSRVDGVLTHTQAAVESLRLTSQEVTLAAARGRLEQARGEAQEGLDELRPFVSSIPRPAELPVAGSLYGPEIVALPFLGIVLLVVGLGLRLGAHRR